MIPFAVGGGSDLLARVIAKMIAEERPVPVTLVNRPGGGSAVGIGYAAASRRADPHTIVLFNAPTQITPIMVPNARGWRELRPVMNFMLDDFLIWVRADSPWPDAAAMVRDARSRPPKAISIGAGGTADAMGITLLGRGTGTEFNTVRFNSGGEVLTALLGGHIQAAIGNPLEMMGHLQCGSRATPPASAAA